MPPSVVPPSFKAFTVALVQLGSIGEDKLANLAHARDLVLRAAAAPASSTDSSDEPAFLVMLPEIFNSPTRSDAYRGNAEPIPDPRDATGGGVVEVADLPPKEVSPTLHMLSSVAKEAGIWLIGGSIPERQDGQEKLWNTATVWDPQGRLVAKHRKIHLYDVNIPGGIRFEESKSLSPGSQITVFETPRGKVAIAICYDIRFPRLLSYILEEHPDVVAFLLPSAFNMTTGPRDWEILQRVRAIDNQIYVGMASPARDYTADYVAYGHSLIVSPKGEIVSSPTPENEGECLVRARLEPEVMRSQREGLPLWRSQRPDVYGVPGAGRNGAA